MTVASVYTNKEMEFKIQLFNLCNSIKSLLLEIKNEKYCSLDSGKVSLRSNFINISVTNFFKSHLEKSES